MGPASLQRLVRWPTSSRTCSSRKSPRWGSVTAESRPCGSKRAGSGALHEKGGFQSVLGFT